MKKYLVFMSVALISAISLVSACSPTVDTEYLNLETKVVLLEGEVSDLTVQVSYLKDQLSSGGLLMTSTLVIIDEDGMPFATLGGGNDGRGYLTLKGKDGWPVAQLGSDDYGGSLIIFGNDGKIIASLGSDLDGNGHF